MNHRVFIFITAFLGLSLTSLTCKSPAEAQSIFPAALQKFFSASPTPAPSPTVYDTLANRRATLVLPSYTAEQKQRIANQAFYFIQNFYVHQSLKKQAFGVDAVAELKAIAQNASELNDEDLHAKLQSVFSRLRDLHTNYNFPKPFQCYSSFLPFKLEEAEDSSGKDVMAIAGLMNGPDFIALAPAVNKLSFGDVLVAYNGLDPDTAVESFDELGAGANPYAQKRMAMQSLTARNHTNSFLPAHNSEHLTFRKMNGALYEIDLPWISVADNDCLNPQAPSPSPANKDGQPEKKEPNPFLQAVNPLQVKFNEIFKDSKKQSANEEPIDTDEKTVHYQILKTAEGNFGMLRLDSFTPADAKKSTQIISGLLQKELSATHGLILDLRGNGGGDLSYGEELLQLFTAKQVQTTKFTMLASAANQDFLQVTHISSTYLDLVTKALAANQELTEATQLTSLADANSLSQSYTKPIIVLVDSACFSTCDMFTAGMQDNGIATVISTDVSTGGGGANVIVYSDFEKAYEKNKTAAMTNPFLDLPSGQDMRVAWRESSRIGLNAGKLIENTGIIADQTVKTTVSDLVNLDSVIFNNLTGQLATQYQNSTKSSIVLDTSQRIDFVDGEPFTLPIRVGGTSFVNLMQNGVAFAGAEINAESENLVIKTLIIPPEKLTALPDLSTVEIDGWINLQSGAKQKVWRKLISLRRIPAARITGTLQMDFTGGTTAPLKLYNTGPAGFMIVNNVLRVGPGPNYPNQNHAEASLFVSFPKDQKLALTYISELHSEPGFDFFRVSIYQNGTELPMAAPASGDVSKGSTTLDLSFLAGKTAEIRFTFDSDALVNGIGPLISGLNLQPVQTTLAQKK